MQLLPNLEQAVIRIEKIRNYVLNMEHTKGRYKAVVFKEKLGIESRHSETLAELIRSTLPSAAAEHREDMGDEHGDYWTTYHHMVGFNALSAVVTVAWIFKKEEIAVPQLISCYIEVQKQEKLRKLLNLT